MTFDIITLFPDMFKGPFDESIVKRARDKKLVEINLHNLRKWAVDKRGSVDDRPYGGCVGMVLRVEPIFNTIEETRNKKQKTKTILMDPRGKKFNQKMAREFAKLDQLIIICGHYEGVDERVKDYLIDEAVSVGDYVLTGGEIPAMVITDTVTRLIPGVLEPEATEIESFSNDNYLEFPQYTRPETFNGWKVPEILLNGNHAEIKKWRENR